MADRAWKEIDLSALSHNCHQLKAILPSTTEIMAIVKADAYGHGAEIIAKHLQKLHIRNFGVATLDEAIALRNIGIRGQILVLGFTPAERIDELAAFKIIQTVIDAEHARRLSAKGIKINTHLKIDTGMHRIGIDWRDTKSVCQTLNLPNLRCLGIYSHLATADSHEASAQEFAKLQIDAFKKIRNQVEIFGCTRPKSHLLSSYGLINYPQDVYDYVRIGLGLYGLLDPEKTIGGNDFQRKPVLSLHSQIAMIRKVDPGESVGYDRQFMASRASRIAVIPLGYADGLPRSLSCGKGRVLVCGQYAPISGLVCMDQTCIDVTDIPEAACGDMVTIIGFQGDQQITAIETAKEAGTIVNELVSRFGKRLEVKVNI